MMRCTASSIILEANASDSGEIDEEEEEGEESATSGIRETMERWVLVE